MLQYTRQFAPTYGVPTTNTYFGPSEQWYTLHLTPGNPNASYTIDTATMNGLTYGYSEGNGTKFTNYLNFGITNISNIIVNSIQDTQAINSPSINGDPLTYSFNVVYGESATFLVSMSSYVDNIFTNSYDITNLVATPTTGAKVAGILNYGVTTSTLAKQQYKVWRLSFTPQQVAAYAEQPVNLGFQTISGISVPLFNLSVIGYDSLNDPVVMHDSVTATGLNIDSATIANLKMHILPNPYSWTWQKLMPDGTSTTLTLGTVPATSSSYAIGPVAVNAAVVTNLQLRNVTTTGYIVTGVVVTCQTQNIASLVTAAKTIVAGDYVVTFKDPITNTVVTIPTCTATALTMTGTANAQLNPLSALAVTIAYTPKIKVTGTSTYITPFVSTTAAGIASLINNNRKIRIQVMGYPIGGSTTPVALGDPIAITASLL